MSRPDQPVIDIDRIRATLVEVRARGRRTLLEPEARDLLEAMGIRVPPAVFVPVSASGPADIRSRAADAAAIALESATGPGDLRSHTAAETVPVPVPGTQPGELDADAVDEAVFALDGDRVVVRAVSSSVVHKTELGGVAIVARDAGAILAAANAMRAQLRAAGLDDLAGVIVAEQVCYAPGLGGQLLVSARWTDDAGPVVSVGAGGTEAETIAADLRPEARLAILSPVLTPRDRIMELLRATTAVRLATTPIRGRPSLLPIDTLEDVVGRFLDLAGACMPADLSELEVNPLVVADGDLVALDVLAVLAAPAGGVPLPAQELPAAEPSAPEPPAADPSAPEPPAAEPSAPEPPVSRPLSKLPRMLEPRSVALIGVSAAMNPGHIILRNLLRDGFDPAGLTVVKPGATDIDGCRCVPDVASLPGKVDLFVVAVSATQAAGVVADVIERDAAETILVIPGGLEEKLGTEAIVGRMRAALDASRARPDGGPLVNGGNCLGFRSWPGRIDTMFIPVSKLAPPGSDPAPLAIVAQSGAFAITRLGRLADLHPRYLVTVGNQMDLTVGDHVAYLADDPSIVVFGVYVEGFRPLDGIRLLEAARRIGDRGGTVVLYLAGRTSAGAAASASHTASIAGDAAVMRALAEEAGVLVADTLDEFDDLVRLGTLTTTRAVPGRRLGALSNAGFECVAIGDSLGALELARFDRATADRLGAILEATGAGGVVDVHNPLDATPMADDAAFLELAEAVLGVPGVDVGVLGVVPLTAALRTLPPGPGHDEDLAASGAIAARLVDLWRRTTKAWVAIVDAGPLYDPFVVALEAGGLPVFRTADRAMRALNAIVGHRLR